MKKTVVITGASSGIGEALAIEFAKNNFNIVIAARTLTKLLIVKEQCERFEAKVLIVACDVSVESDCKNLMEAALNEFNSIDILINNAGISMRALFSACEINVIQQVMDINFWGTVYCTKYALPAILSSKGTVVGISSIAGIKGLPARTGYSASKFAMNGFLESLRIENLKTGINVLIACPGYTASNIRNTALNKEGKKQSESPFDEQKLMPAEKVAQLIFKGIEKRKKYLYLSFEGKILLFLNKWFPLLMDKIVYNKVSKEKDSPF